MRDNKNLFSALFEGFKNSGPGRNGALLAFVLALLIVIFGILKTLFILLLTLLGYYVGIRYFSNQKTIKELLDRIFPPGRFR